MREDGPIYPEHPRDCEIAGEIMDVLPGNAGIGSSPSHCRTRCRAIPRVIDSPPPRCTAVAVRFRGPALIRSGAAGMATRRNPRPGSPGAPPTVLNRKESADELGHGGAERRPVLGLEGQRVPREGVGAGDGGGGLPLACRPPDEPAPAVEAQVERRPVALAPPAADEVDRRGSAGGPVPVGHGSSRSARAAPGGRRSATRGGGGPPGRRAPGRAPP